MPKISVIVPVYKVEPYLRRCVDSILNQTYSDFELLLVDDGSPDGSSAICDEYAQTDSRVRVISHLNGGVSDARNQGLAMATGDYICFADSDDWATEKYLAELMGSDADLVGQTALCVSEDGSVLERGYIVPENITALSRKSIYRMLSDGSLSWVHCKRFKRELIEKNQVRFVKEIDFAEDTMFVIDYVQKCATVLITDTANYRYVKYSSRETLSGIFSVGRIAVLEKANRMVSRRIADDPLDENRIYVKRMMDFLAFCEKVEPEGIEYLQYKDNIMEMFDREKLCYPFWQYRWLWVWRFPRMRKLFGLVYPLFWLAGDLVTNGISHPIKKIKLKISSRLQQKTTC